MFSNSTFSKIISGIPAECHIFWIQIRSLNCLKLLSADDTGAKRVMSEEKYSIDVQGEYLLPLHGDTIASN